MPLTLPIRIINEMYIVNSLPVLHPQLQWKYFKKYKNKIVNTANITLLTLATS